MRVFAALCLAGTACATAAAIAENSSPRLFARKDIASFGTPVAEQVDVIYATGEQDAFPSNEGVVADVLKEGEKSADDKKGTNSRFC